MCTACPAGMTSSGKHDASGDDTTCDATSCDINEKVSSHMCAACPSGKTSNGDHDASGDNTECDTTCDATTCDLNSVYQDVVAKDGVGFLITREASTSMVALGKSLVKVADLYKGKSGYSVN